MNLIVTMGNRTNAKRMFANIHPITMQKLGLKPGDFIKMIGKKETYAIVWPWPEIQEDQIGLDGIQRKNLGNINIGDSITVEKADLKPAQKVVIAMENIDIKGYEKEFRNLIYELYNGKPVTVDDIITIEIPIYRPLTSRVLMLRVIKVFPERYGIITNETKIEFSSVSPDSSIPRVFYEDIGGLDDAIRKIREMVELPIKHPELFQRLGINPPKGVLLYGPPGTGKTLLAKAVATETNANFYHISGPEIVSKFVGESEERLRKIFENARKNAPSIIFIDEIDSIAPKRSEIKGEVEKRLVAQLLTLMDGLESRGDVVVIAATNRPNDIDEALRRPGRFDREIEINPPDRDGRLEILRIHTRKMPLDKDVKLEEIADITHGFTGADLEALCKEAALTTLRRYLKDEEIQKQLDEGKLDMATLQKIVVSKQDFYEALNHVQPSALREIYVQKPNVKWEDVGGMSKVKKELQEIIYYTLKNPEKMEEYGLTPIKGVLLYGPPGTGKTLLAKAVATEANANFIAINGPEILSKWVGESERAIRELLKKARQNSPTVVFIDEIDSIAPKRSEDDPTRVGERLVSTLLTELDGIKSNRKILILGATNRLDMIDPALLRPGRFDRVIEIKPPNKEDRLEILKIHTKKMPLDEDVNLEQIAEITEGFTGAQLSDIARKAALQALRNNTKVKQEYFIKAIEESKEKTNIKGYL